MPTASLISTKVLILLQLVSFPVICTLPYAKGNIFLAPAIFILQVISSSIMVFGNFTAGELFAILAPSISLFIHGYILNKLSLRKEISSFDMEMITPIFYIMTLPAALFVEVVAIHRILN